jgi:hypothetical protein
VLCRPGRFRPVGPDDAAPAPDSEILLKTQCVSA